MTENFSFLLEKPSFTVKKLLIIEPLAPLSMVAGLPGKYYRSQPKPTTIMLWGMLENALGWHFDKRERTEIAKKIKNKLKDDFISSDLGFVSLLQHHVKLEDNFTDSPSSTFHYDDLWSQQLKGGSFVGGSRNYSAEVIPLMNAVHGKKITTGDKSEAKRGIDMLKHFAEGDLIHNSVLSPYFPQYYSSPTPREYIVRDVSYSYIVETSEIIMSMLEDALIDPAAPLYLGTNDGWVDVRLEEIS